jgi:uncharacterized protein
MQGFYPNDRMAYPLYEAISDGGAIALFQRARPGSEAACRAAWACG